MWRSLKLALASSIALAIGIAIGDGGAPVTSALTSFLTFGITDNLRAFGILLVCMFIFETARPLLKIVSARRKRRRSQLLDSLLPLQKQKDVYANLDELMPLWVKAHGRRTARKIRRRQMRRIVIGHYLSAIIEAFAKVAGIVRGP